MIASSTSDETIGLARMNPNAQRIHELCEQIRRVEGDADDTHEAAMIALFRDSGAAEALHLIRAREVLDRLLAGKTSRAIAEELFIAIKTVEFHRARIKEKLGVESTADLFRLCLGAPAPGQEIGRAHV